MSFSTWVENSLAQLAHVGWGAFAVLALSKHMHLVWAVSLVVAFAAAKEAVFDPLTETPQLRGSGWTDFAFWCVGAALGAVAAVV